jgi:Zn-finger nucleic acid-binding protein
MTFTEDGTHMRNRCPECSGLLLEDEEVAQALTPGRGKPRAALTRDQVGALPDGGLACPRDGAGMRRLEHHGVELDLCPECRALWLDAGELEKIRSLKKGKGGRARVMAGAAAVAGGAAIAAAATPSAAASPGILGGVGEAVVEGGIELVLEFAGEAIGALLEGLF